MKMDNFEAIKQMERSTLEAFLDQVYLTGLNTGLYAAKLSDTSGEQMNLLDENPFDTKWLNSEAENAVLYSCDSENGEALDALAAAILRVAGIELPNEDECKTGEVASDMQQVVAVEPNPDFTLTLTFNNGEIRLFDCNPLLKPGTVFETFMQWENFRRVHVDEVGGCVAWDINPNVDSKVVWNNHALQFL